VREVVDVDAEIGVDLEDEFDTEMHVECGTAVECDAEPFVVALNVVRNPMVGAAEVFAGSAMMYAASIVASS